MALKIITAPTAEPITLAEAKIHLRVDDDLTGEDALIEALIVAARQGAEQITGRALMPQVLELALDDFPDEIVLPRPPLASVSSVKYLDANETLQTLSSDRYLIDDYSQPSKIVPAYGETWPSALDRENSVLVRYTAGYANAAAVPQEIKAWMLLRIGALYENRESVAAGAALSELPFVDRLLDAYKVWGA